LEEGLEIEFLIDQAADLTRPMVGIELAVKSLPIGRFGRPRGLQKTTEERLWAMVDFSRIGIRVTSCRTYGLKSIGENANSSHPTGGHFSLPPCLQLGETSHLKVVDRGDLTAATRQANPISARWAARLLRQLDAGAVFPPSYPYPVHAWRLGNDTLFIGLGAEAVVDYALRFKREFGPGTWVCGYADDMIAYIPSRRVWEERGYEGGSNLFEYGRPAFRWADDVEDRIAVAVHTLVKRIRE
jgi:hypothetical protein